MAEGEFDTNPWDVRAYRTALGRFGTGVAVVLARSGEGVVRGITVNSFCSISLDPPIVSWAIDAQSERYNHFVQAEHFSVTVLRAAQQDLATRLTRFQTSHLEADQYETIDGLPCLPGGLSLFRCARRFCQTVGDHAVIFGTVTGFEDFGGCDGLGYHNGQFARLNGD